jgi:ribosomal protein S18 acetylase RimI-like enzyme
MTVDVDIRVRSAAITDQRQISNLIHFGPQVHRHLDWRDPLDWIGSPPYLILEHRGQVTSALACPPDPPKIGWVRLFANAGRFPASEAWQPLWESAQKELSGMGVLLAAAIVLQDWFHELLLASGFSTRQEIVMLERNDAFPPVASPVAGVSIRPMMPYDLAAVSEVDAAAFDPLWQNSFDALRRAYPQSALATVAEKERRVIGYQISTRNPLGVHLARLAVLPEVQGSGIGRVLLADLVQRSGQRGLTHFTVNTQSDNAASLALYQKTGFREMKDRFPVYQLEIG